MTATVALLVVAAGSGTRLGVAAAAVGAKALVRIGERPMLEHCLRSALPIEEPVVVVVVAPAGREADCRAAALAAGVDPDAISVVAGGPERQHSVAAGLAVLPASIEVVLVHDAARPLTPASQVQRVVDAVRRTGDGVVPTVPVVDTLRMVGDQDALGATVDRSRLAAMQTPQGFPRAALVDAYARAHQSHTDQSHTGQLYTDDAALFAAAGHRIRRVAGDAAAFKVTTRADLERAEGMLGAPGVRIGVRTGIGTDAHRFDRDRELWLGDLHWPGEVGLAGHSDGDALSHAIVDALLSAAGLGDIGGLFGTDAPALAGAHGRVFLEGALERIRSAGFELVNVSAQVVGDRPRIGPRRAELEAHLTQLLGAPVSVSGTTSDGLGMTGEGRGLAAISSAAVRQR